MPGAQQSRAAEQGTAGELLPSCLTEVRRSRAPGASRFPGAQARHVAPRLRVTLSPSTPFSISGSPSVRRDFVPSGTGSA